jgi:peptide/nickel transport system substrate-binding protein
MRFKLKLHKFKSGLQERQANLKSTNFDDFTRIYKRVLKRIPDISHLKNIVLFCGLSTLTILILFAQRFAALNDYLPTKPAPGGLYAEGVQGEIKQLNPLYSPINNAETSATSLIFSGLTKRTEGGKMEPDLAENWTVSEDKKIYTFHLRGGVKWHDGKPFTADDVTFTFSKIQDPYVASAYFNTWKGVEVTATDEKTVVFALPDPYVYFLNQTNAPIVPKHLLEAVPTSSFKSSEFSKTPVGTGPYTFKEFKELKNHQEVWLEVSADYHDRTPYIKQIAIKAYKNYSAVIEAYRYRSIMAIERLNSGEVERGSSLPNMAGYNLSIPEYDSLIFNLRSGLTQDKALREAVSLVIDRSEIIDEVYDGWATPVYSAVLPGTTGYSSQLKVSPDINVATQKLTAAGYVKNAEGKLSKANQISTLRIVTDDSDLKKKEAKLIAARLTLLGFEVSLESYPFSTFIEDYVRTRNFDLLLITQSAGADTDLYSFFHGNMKDDPGLNFSGLSLREVDKYIEEARNSQDAALRDAKYQAIAKIIAREIPVINICRPSYIFGASRDIQGIKEMKLAEPKDKYTQIGNWYVKEVRDY